MCTLNFWRHAFQSVHFILLKELYPCVTTSSERSLRSLTFYSNKFYFYFFKLICDSKLSYTIHMLSHTIGTILWQITFSMYHTYRRFNILGNTTCRALITSSSPLETITEGSTPNPNTILNFFFSRKPKYDLLFLLSRKTCNSKYIMVLIYYLPNIYNTS